MKNRNSLNKENYKTFICFFESKKQKNGGVECQRSYISINHSRGPSNGLCGTLQCTADHLLVFRFTSILVSKIYGYLLFKKI